MNIHPRSLLPILLLALLIGLSACQSMQPTPAPTLAPVHPPTRTPVKLAPVATSTPAASPTPILPRPTPLDPAIQTVQDYFAALQNGDGDGAAKYFSNFSLMVAEITRGEAAGAIKDQVAQGTKWSALQVLESRAFDQRTSLVHVRYQLTGKDAKTGEEVQSKPDEWWALRLESGQWRYNRDNLIDFQTLDEPQQTTAGLTVKPLQVTRYTDHLRLTLLVQNQTNDAIVLGQPNEIMATFLFGDQQVQAEPARLIFERLRSYPDTAIDVVGLFENYPDGVVIRQWKNLKVEPWFRFELH
jgi:hypothetical protein